ncbi:MAG: hypothetical protein J7M14_04875 [Planctomycetes bacterium]|nr:hypothetical protein [Planctomycetota bacterium]
MRDRAAFDVIGIGTISVDDVLTVAKYPQLDQKAEVLAQSRHCGGQVSTALAAAVALGARCAFAGVLGNDELSTFARASLERAGVNCDHLAARSGAGPIHSVIIAEGDSGGRTIFYAREGFQLIETGAMNEELIGLGRVLLVDQSGAGRMIAAARTARRLNVPIVADMEWPDEPGVKELMALVDHLILPRQFAGAVTGLSNPTDMVRSAGGNWPGACTVVTCGEEGCYYAVAGGQVRCAPALSVNVAETTGCGDVFHGAYAAALARGSDIPACIEYASAAAALYACRPNGWRHLPTADDVAAIMAENKR